MARTPQTPSQSRADAVLTRMANVQDELGVLQFDAELSPGGIWGLNNTQQSLLHQAWMMRIYKVMIEAFVSGAVEQQSDLSDTDYQFAWQLCEEFHGTMIDRFLRDQASAGVGGNVSPAKLAAFPWPPNNASPKGIWNMQIKAWERVSDELQQAEQRGIPPRYQDVYKHLFTQLVPINAVFARLISQQNQQPQASDTTTVFKIGQQLWAPFLIEGNVYQRCRDAPETLDDLQLGFDPWKATDPEVRRLKANDRDAERQLRSFWKKAVPAVAKRLLDELEAAAASGKIKVRTGAGSARADGQAPWATIYVVQQDVTLGGKAFKPGQQCVFFATESDLSIKGAGNAPEELWYKAPTLDDLDRRLGFPSIAFTDPKLWEDFKSVAAKVQELIDVWSRINPADALKLLKQILELKAAGKIEALGDMGKENLPLWPYQFEVTAKEGINVGSRHFDQGVLLVPYVREITDTTASIELVKSGQAALPTSEKLERELGFPPWGFTDTTIRARREQVPDDWRTLVEFWRNVQNLADAKAIHAWIRQAKHAGTIRVQAGEGFDQSPPWAAKLRVLSTVAYNIGVVARNFEPGQFITLYVTETANGGKSVAMKGAGRAN